MIKFGVFYACEHAFCFSERPSVEASYEIEIKTYRKDEGRLLAESIERMYEREYNVSTESDVYLHLAFICTTTDQYIYTLIYTVFTFLKMPCSVKIHKLDDNDDELSSSSLFKNQTHSVNL
jgi:hypothetical protein